MSLINDALKRAKDAQQRSPASAPGPQFRPAEPAQAPKEGMSLTVPVVIAVVALVGLLIAWQFRQKTAARTPAPASNPIVANPSLETKAPAAVAPVASVKSTPPPAEPAGPAPPPVPELRLQAIFFTPGRSTAMINGKTVRTGDTIRNFRVAKITQTSATLVSATETNVMMLLDQ